MGGAIFVSTRRGKEVCWIVIEFNGNLPGLRVEAKLRQRMRVRIGVWV